MARKSQPLRTWADGIWGPRHGLELLCDIQVKKYLCFPVPSYFTRHYCTEREAHLPHGLEPIKLGSTKPPSFSFPASLTPSHIYYCSQRILTPPPSLRPYSITRVLMTHPVLWRVIPLRGPPSAVLEDSSSTRKSDVFLYTNKQGE